MAGAAMMGWLEVAWVAGVAAWEGQDSKGAETTQRK